PVNPGVVGLGVGVVEKAVDGVAARHHLELGVGVSNMPPAAGVDVADLNELRIHEAGGLLGFEKQFFAALVLGVVLAEDELDDFLGVGQGVFPAPEAGFAKSAHAGGVLADLLFGGEEAIAV